jgi:hypothetical protein
MRRIPIPAYCRSQFELVDPVGGTPRRADVIITPAELWPHWPEALETGWATMEIGPMTIAIRVEGLAPVR